jgi:hypothetical protein
MLENSGMIIEGTMPQIVRSLRSRLTAANGTAFALKAANNVAYPDARQA